MSLSTLRTRAIALGAALALGALALPMTAAHAAGVGTLSGGVYSSNNYGINGVTVSLETPVTGAPTGLSAVARADGGWQIDNIPEGDYVVHYSGAVTGYALDATTLDAATTYTVVANGYDYVFDAISSITLGPNYSVSVVGSDGASLPICPSFYNADNPDDGPYGGDCTTTGGVSTGRMTSGRWIVQLADFTGGYVSRWLGGDGTKAHATVVTIPDTGVADLGQVTLAVAAKVRVRILKADTGLPFGQDEVCVNAFVARTTEATLANGCTDSAGYATVGGIPAGTTTIEAAPYSLDYVTRWSGSTRTQAKAALVRVTVGTTTQAPAIRLARSASISGVVRDKKTGAPLAGYCAATGPYSTIVGDDGTRGFGSSCSDADGRYTIPGLDAGAYKIEWIGRNVDTTVTADHAVTWYDGTTHANAEAVEVTNGRTTTGINVSLPLGGAIVGDVRDQNGNPRALDILVSEATTGYDVSQGYSGDTGTFTVRSVPTGRMIVKYWLPDGSYVYWNGTPTGTRDATKAKPIATKAGATVTITPVTIAQ